MNLDADFWKRAEQTVQSLDASPELAARIQIELDAFYVNHPNIVRTRLGEAMLASILVEHFSTADSQSAPNPETQTQKVA